MPPHLLRCQGIAVGNYSFTLGRLEAEVPRLRRIYDFDFRSMREIPKYRMKINEK